MSDKKVAGSIGPVIVGGKDAVSEKIDAWRKKRVVADDVVYNGDDFTFYIHGKHPTLIGAEAVITLTLADALAMVVPVLGNVVLPMVAMSQQVAQKAVDKKS